MIYYTVITVCFLSHYLRYGFQKSLIGHLSNKCNKSEIKKASMTETKNATLRENGNIDIMKQKHATRISNKKIFRTSGSLFCQCATFLTLTIALAFSGSISTIIIYFNVNYFESIHQNPLYHVTPNANFSPKSIPHGPSEDHNIPGEKPKPLQSIQHEHKVSCLPIYII